MNYDDLYEVLRNASAATLSRFEQSGRAARAFVHRYHMWRFVVQREYELQYHANYDERDNTHMRPQMKAFLDAISTNKGNEGTYWKRFYEFLHKRLGRWLQGTSMKGFYIGIQTLRQLDNDDNGAHPLQSVTIFLPEIDASEFTPGMSVGAFALDYVRQEEEEEEEEELHNAFEVLVNDTIDGVVRGKTVSRKVAEEQSMVRVTVPPGGQGQMIAPDGRFLLSMELSPASLRINAFFFKNMATTEKLVSHAIQTSFWI